MSEANTNIPKAPLAVIYSRIASARAGEVEDCLSARTRRTRAYAGRMGYEVVAAFQDHASGMDTAFRPGLQDMLAFLREHPNEKPIIVCVDDIAQVARDIAAYMELRAAITDAGGILEIPSAMQGSDPGGLAFAKPERGISRSGDKSLEPSALEVS